MGFGVVRAGQELSQRQWKAFKMTKLILLGSEASRHTPVEKRKNVA